MKRLLLLFALLMLLAAPMAQSQIPNFDVLKSAPSTSRWPNIPDPQYSMAWDYRPDAPAYGDDIVPLYFQAGVVPSIVSGNPMPEADSYFSAEPGGTAVGPQDKQARKRVPEIGFRRDTGYAWDQCSDRAQCTGAFAEDQSMVKFGAPFDLKKFKGFRIAWRIAGTSWDKHNTVVISRTPEDLRSPNGDWVRPNDYFAITWLDNPSYGYKSFPTIQPGQSLQFRVRALYKGSKKGPWSETLTIPHPAQGCGDANYEMVVSNLTACWKRY